MASTHPADRADAAPPAELPIHIATIDTLTPRQLYAILQLRVEVFTVEQDCPYQDLDGKDGLPGTLILWQEDPADPTRCASTIRMLEDGEDRIIGRVVTAPEFRGRGLSAQLMRRGIELAAGRMVEISAQAHREAWYGGFGFVRHGENYLEDGIPTAPCDARPTRPEPMTLWADDSASGHL